MPITYQTNTAFGSLLESLVGRLIKDQADILRLMNYANAATGGGVTPTGIETDPLLGVGVGNGATVYGLLQSIQAGLTSISSTITLAPLDQGR